MRMQMIEAALLYIHPNSGCGESVVSASVAWHPFKYHTWNGARFDSPRNETALNYISLLTTSHVLDLYLRGPDGGVSVKTRVLGLQDGGENGAGAVKTSASAASAIPRAR